MTAVATIEPVTTAEPRVRRPAGNADAFAALLLDAQAVTALAAAGGVADASGLEPRLAGDEPDAQRARIDGETQEARDSEAQQRRSGSTHESSGRADAIRSAQTNGGAEGANSQSKAAPSPGAPATAAAAMAAGDGAESGASLIEAQPDTGSEDQPVLARNAEPALQTPSADAKSNSAEAPPVEKSTPSTAIAVPTAGAARASEGAGEGRSSAAQTVARIVATSAVERAEPAAAPPAQTTRDAPAGKPAAKSPTPHQPSTSGGKASETESPRRAEFEQLVRMLRGNLGTRNSSATIRLDPPELGRMKVDVRMTDDVLHLRIEVASAETRDLLNERVNHLAAALREHDIRMERWEIVAVDDSNGGRQADAQASNDARDSARQTPDPSGSAARRTPSAAAGAAADDGGAPSDFQATDPSAQLDLRV